MEILFFLFVTASVSAFIQATTGFGYGILFMAIAPNFIAVPLASILSLSTGIFGNIVNVSKRIRKINYKQVLIPLFFSTIATYIAIEWAKVMDMGMMRRMLGVLLFILAIWFVFFSSKVKIKPTFLSCTIVGLLSGLGTGLFSISGPPMVVYYLSALEDKETYMATIQTYFLLNSTVTLAMKFFMGAWPAVQWSWYAITLCGILLGIIIGGKLYSKLNGEMMKKYVYGFMALSGLWIFIQG